MDTDEIVRQTLADAVYYMTLNLIGLYVRYVGEINMRRGFLDKRGCIETTFKLKYEKEQEVRQKEQLLNAGFLCSFPVDRPFFCALF